MKKVCGLPGPDGSIQSFTPHGKDPEPSPTPAWDKGPAAEVTAGSAGAVDRQGFGSRLVVYIFIGLGALIVSYLVSGMFVCLGGCVPASSMDLFVLSMFRALSSYDSLLCVYARAPCVFCSAHLVRHL